MNWLFRYANPHNFMRLSNVLLPITAVATALCLGVGLYLGFTVPADYQQGSTVLLLFIHVPADVAAEAAYGKRSLPLEFSGTCVTYSDHSLRMWVSIAPRPQSRQTSVTRNGCGSRDSIPRLQIGVIGRRDENSSRLVTTP